MIVFLNLNNWLFVLVIILDENKIYSEATNNASNTNVLSLFFFVIAVATIPIIVSYGAVLFAVTILNAILCAISSEDKIYSTLALA